MDSPQELADHFNLTPVLYLDHVDGKETAVIEWDTLVSVLREARETKRDLSRALDEIYNLRRQMAFEVEVTKAHADFKTFPKSRRVEVVKQVERMILAARGHSEVAIAGQYSQYLDSAMREIGVEPVLTYSQWKAERS